MKPVDTDFEDEIFPLPLTGMEKFHLAADSSAFPNTIMGRLRFEGQLDVGRTRTTINHLLRRHLLVGKTVSLIGKRPHWVVRSGPTDTTVGDDAIQTAIDKILTWHRDVDFSAWHCDHLHGRNDQAIPWDDLGDWSGPPQIDLDHHHGIRIWVWVGKSESVIISALHHAVGDGVGGVQFLSDFCQIYDNLHADRCWDHSLRRLDRRRMLDRGRMGLLQWNYLRHLWKQPIALLGMMKFLRRPFSQFLPHQPPNPTANQPANQPPGIVGQWVDENDSQRIQSFAHQHNVRVNSVVMMAVFKAIQNWLQWPVTTADTGNPPGSSSTVRTNRRFESSPWIRMLLPISYRSKSDLRLPMTNKATLVQVDRNAAQMRDEKSFLFYLNREIDIVLGWQFDKLFLMAINLMACFPQWLNTTASNTNARGTIVFTNLGEPFRIKTMVRPGWVGPLRWKDFDLVGPVRSQMPVNFTLQRHRAGQQIRYRLSLHFDRRVLNEDQALEFLSEISKTIAAVIGQPLGDRPTKEPSKPN